MAETLTQMILRRVELGKTVGAGIDALLDDAAAGYGAYLAPAVVDGEPSVDARQHLVLLRRKTDAHVENLKAIDLGVLNQTSDKDFVKTELDVVTRAAVVKVRRVVDVASGVYGKEILPAIGLSGVTSRVPLRLYERGRRAQGLLRGPDLNLQPKAEFAITRDSGNAFSAPALADELEPELTNLGLLVDTRYAGDREQTIARVRRQRVVEEFDLSMLGIIRIVQGMLFTAGRKDLADRFRARLRHVPRPSSASQESQSQQTPPADPPAGTPPTQSP